MDRDLWGVKKGLDEGIDGSAILKEWRNRESMRISRRVCEEGVYTKSSRGSTAKKVD